MHTTDFPAAVAAAPALTAIEETSVVEYPTVNSTAAGVTDPVALMAKLRLTLAPRAAVPEARLRFSDWPQAATGVLEVMATTNKPLTIGRKPEQFIGFNSVSSPIGCGVPITLILRSSYRKEKN